MKQYIGYWYNENGAKDFPMPTENEVSNNNEAIQKLQAIIPFAIKMSARGSSKCRCCEKSNGSAEYVFKIDNIDYRMPSGYEHYLSEHKIKPSPLINKLYEDLILNKKVNEAEDHGIN